MKSVKLIFVVLIALFALFGCTATVKNAPEANEKPKYAPMDPNEHYGIDTYGEEDGKVIKMVSYDKYSKSTGKEDAYKKMYIACEGKYKIVKEITIGEDSKNIVLSNDGVISSDTIVSIKYMCVE